jgi:hypothetical protein
MAANQNRYWNNHRWHAKTFWNELNYRADVCKITKGATAYSYLKCIVYDKLLKSRQSFWITPYFYSHRSVCLKCMYNEIQCYILHVAEAIPYSYSVTRILTATAKRSLYFTCAQKLPDSKRSSKHDRRLHKGRVITEMKRLKKVGFEITECRFREMFLVIYRAYSSMKLVWSTLCMKYHAVISC